MRSILLAGICLAALSGTADAQGVTVNDPASILQQIKSAAQDVKAFALQAQQYATQARELETEIETMNGFIHNPTLSAAMGLANQAGLGNSLPVNPLALQGLVSGNTSPTGILGALGNLASGTFNQNHIYSPTDGGLASQELIANGQSVANVQGAAQSVFQDLRNHLPILAALQDKLKTADNPKDVLDAQGALQAEIAWTHNTNAELSALEIDYRTQQDARVQRDNESLEQGFDAFLAQAKANGRGL